MFYHCDRNDHGLPYNPFKACVIPRPIGWVSTRSRAGVPNLSPFSFFSAVNERPPMVAFCANGRHVAGGEKDSVLNARETGEFVVNLATYALRDAINASSASVERDVDEFGLAGVTAMPGRLVKAPCVKESPVHLECAVHDILELPSSEEGWISRMVIGRVLGIHVDDAMIEDGMVKAERLQAISRLGYMDYAVTREVFQLNRPA
ncbi:Flavin reductase like domain [Bordetella hinzii]|uniref:flavin reductase family protein n=1 Tax=Bordetella hinzii TaxID=103855 RepID=UPI0003F5029C|nr:flavin reductase family protein [Bordetella hinzii]AKQ55022.1 Flavin reductase like domain protein [Bordetella hinzii]KCB33868.1 flavin reductase-like protein [Bordetella hinzii L60]KCB50839.1 flavin reductase-like protein [Bordetella hinzii 1277]QDJ34796.1 flavin reductase [Bordetella hinzii]QWF39401.1 flavin reductase family protein [Bordetella hinzii]